MFYARLGFLNSKQIGATGAKALAQALAQNSSLRGSVLDDNQIGDEGAQAIGNALAKNTTLKSLELNDNHICNDRLYWGWGSKPGNSLGFRGNPCDPDR